MVVKIIFFFVFLNQLIKGFNLSYQTKKSRTGKKVPKNPKKSGPDTLGLTDGRIANDQIFVSTAANEKQYPRLNRSSWDFQVNDHNEIVSVRFVFASRVLIVKVFNNDLVGIE